MLLLKKNKKPQGMVGSVVYEHQNNITFFGDAAIHFGFMKRAGTKIQSIKSERSEQFVGAKQASSASPAFDLRGKRAKQVKLLLRPYKDKR
jgi:hypothetical protein